MIKSAYWNQIYDQIKGQILWNQPGILSNKYPLLPNVCREDWCCRDWNCKK